MGLASVTFSQTPTSYTVTGGTNVPLSIIYNDGSKVRLAPAADTDLRLRRSVDINRKDPSVSASAPNGYTQERFQVYFKDPKLLANGKLTVDTANLQLGFDVESTTQEKLDKLDWIAQLCMHASFRAAVTGSNVIA